ncbi:MAG: 1-acyl-sn-glycerol-3-phosphate acyltransferase [Lentisphaerae bacterium]|nr:1-acyl-sn-glycerol-3-phosphate acyltransferase [Lentisphaerota bacterium]
MMPSRTVRIARAALSGAFFVLYGLFALPFALVLPTPLVPPKVGRAVVRIFYRAFVLSARLTGLYAVSMPQATRERLATIRGRVVVMNHVSLIDICIILAHLPDSVCIAKSATKRNPFLAAVVKKLFISNDLGADAAIREGVRFLESGINVVVFPQGTRGGDKFHRGAARLALASRSDIEAFRIAYEPVVLAKGQPWHDMGEHTIRISLDWRGTLHPVGPDGHRAAVDATRRIASILQS